jgi:hypothetical protein
MVSTAAKGVKIAHAGEGEAHYALIDVICAGGRRRRPRARDKRG